MTNRMPLLHPSIAEGSFDLAALLEYEPPEHWRPEEGNRFKGTLIKIDSRRRFGQSAPTMWVLVPPEAFDEHSHRYLVVRASGVVLRKAVEQLKPQPGETVAGKFVGLRESLSTGREYRDFQFAVYRRGGWRMPWRPS